MKLTESQLRQIIREELMTETTISQKRDRYTKSIMDGIKKSMWNLSSSDEKRIAAIVGSAWADGYLAGIEEGNTTVAKFLGQRK